MNDRTNTPNREPAAGAAASAPVPTTDVTAKTAVAGDVKPKDEKAQGKTAETVRKVADGARKFREAIEGKGPASSEDKGTQTASGETLYVIADFTDSTTGQEVKKGDPVPDSALDDEERIERLKAAGVVSNRPAPKGPTVRHQVPGGALSVTYEQGDPNRQSSGDVGARVDNSDRAVEADVGAGAGAGENESGAPAA